MDVCNIFLIWKVWPLNLETFPNVDLETIWFSKSFFIKVDATIATTFWCQFFLFLNNSHDWSSSYISRSFECPFIDFDYFVVSFGVFWGFGKRKEIQDGRSKKAAASELKVIPTSYGFISLGCWPQRKHFWKCSLSFVVIVRAQDKTNTLRDIKCVAVTSTSCITNYFGNQPNVSKRGAGGELSLLQACSFF